jgi:hypothetical protein
MKTVCLYHPPLLDNPNDQLVIEGVVNLLPPCEVVHCRFGQTPPAADCLVVCGTPWLFDRCAQSFKVNELARVCAAFDGRKIAVGIGSSYPLDMVPVLDSADVWRGFDRIAVRDRLAQTLLAAHGITSDRLACPAIGARRFACPKTRRVLVVTAAAPVPAGPFDDIIALSQDDADDAYRRGFRHVQLVTDAARLKRAVLSATVLTASRVHTCIYAHGECEIRPIAVDTRMASYTELGDVAAERAALKEWVDETFN